MSLVGPSGLPLSPARPQDVPEPSPDVPPVPKHATTAFLVIVEPTGRVLVSDNLAEIVIAARKPTFDDIIGAAANVQAEISARKTANMTTASVIQTQMAISQQLQQAVPTGPEAQAVTDLMRGRR